MDSDKTSKCPWNVAPTTMEEAAVTLRKVINWEAENGSAPIHWKPILTVNLLSAMIDRLLMLEDMFWDQEDLSHASAHELSQDTWNPFP